MHRPFEGEGTVCEFSEREREQLLKLLGWGVPTHPPVEEACCHAVYRPGAARSEALPRALVHECVEFVVQRDDLLVRRFVPAQHFRNGVGHDAVVVQWSRRHSCSVMPKRPTLHSWGQPCSIPRRSRTLTGAGGRLRCAKCNVLSASTCMLSMSTWVDYSRLFILSASCALALLRCTGLYPRPHSAVTYTSTNEPTGR
jgi:hypothetical protein